MKTRRMSPLTAFEKLSPNCNKPRTKKISRLSPHCVAGNLSAESTLGLDRFQAYSPSGASCNYAIGSNGRIGLGVEETNRAWTTSSPTNDHQAITFEIANDGGAPDWRMSDIAINTWLDLSVEICNFYGYKKVKYEPKPKTINGAANVENWISTWAKPDEMIITLHNWYSNKACPGPYFTRQLPWLVREMNKRLQDPKWIAEAFVGEGSVPPATNPTPPTPIATEFMPYRVRITASALNVRNKPSANTDSKIVRCLINDPNVYTIIEESNGPGATQWGKLKSGLGWIALDYTKKA